MSNFKIRPDVLLFFAPATDLPQLEAERKTVKTIVTDQGGTAHIEHEWDIGYLNIFQQQYFKSLVIFHYAGHATSEGIQFYTTENGQKRPKITAYADLSTVLTNSFDNLKLAFINGCNSQNAAILLSKVNAVICTNRPVNDAEAHRFAYFFYTNFLKTHTLSKSFKLASCYTELNINPSGMVRGGMSESDLDNFTPSVFEIKYRSETAENQNLTFELLKNAIQPNLTQTKETPITTQTLGAKSKAFLLCNREEQEYYFQEKLETWRADPQQPLFVFIHGKDKHCPSDLFDRFMNYKIGKPEDNFFKQAENVALPNPIEVKLNLEKSKLRLKEGFQSKFGVQNAQTKQWTWQPRTIDNEFIIIRHEQTGVWQDNWKRFWADYVNQFSQELATQLTRKLLIIVTRSAADERDGFTDCFNELAAQNDHVLSLTDFEIINHQHLIDWQNLPDVGLRFDSAEVIKDPAGAYFLDIRQELMARLGG
jgi:hypothetical protein